LILEKSYENSGSVNVDEGLLKVCVWGKLYFQSSQSEHERTRRRWQNEETSKKKEIYVNEVSKDMPRKAIRKNEEEYNENITYSSHVRF
jgi:hypothetical protein